MCNQICYGSEEEETDEEFQIGYGSDTSTAQAKTCKNIQSFLWRGMRLTREQCRRGRLIQYENYEAIPLFGQTVVKVQLTIPSLVYVKVISTFDIIATFYVFKYTNVERWELVRLLS
ncbi:hypothetical protein Hanom_Chr03g00234051 [Helianthus anomalus]